MIKIPLLTSEDIEVKIKQVTRTGALALLYKTARTDRRILNEVFGMMNWTSDFRVIDDTLYCGIGIRESKEDPFVWKWEAGGESENALEEGVKAKANASDAFKRAGFAVGIGEELYTSPQIRLDVATVGKGENKWVLQDPYAKYVVTHIAYNEKTRVITELEISNAKTNVVVFSWQMATTGAMAQKMTKTLADADTTSEAAPAKKETKKSLKSLVTSIGKIVKKMYAAEGNSDTYNSIVAEITGDTSFKCNSATDDEYDTVNAIYEALKQRGYSE